MADRYVDLLAMARNELILRAQAIDQWQEALDEGGRMAETILPTEETTDLPDPDVDPTPVPVEEEAELTDDLQPPTATCRYCDNDAPTRGRYAGRCVDHRHLPAVQADGTEKPKPKRRRAARPKRRPKTEATPASALELAARDVLQAKAAIDMWTEKLNDAAARVDRELALIREAVS